MFHETSYGMGAFDWGQFLGGIGTAIGGAFGNPPYYGGNTGAGTQNSPQAIACANAGGYWNPINGTCIPRNTAGNDLSFSGSTFFWLLAGVVAFSLLSKRR